MPSPHGGSCSFEMPDRRAAGRDAFFTAFVAFVTAVAFVTFAALTVGLPWPTDLSSSSQPSLNPPSLPASLWPRAQSRRVVLERPSLPASLLLRQPNALEARSVDDVGDGAEAAAALRKATTCLPSVGAHSELLAQEGEEDSSLLVPEARKLLQALRSSAASTSPDQTFSALPS